MAVLVGVGIGDKDIWASENVRAAPVCMLAAWLFVVAQSGELSIGCICHLALNGVLAFSWPVYVGHLHLFFVSVIWRSTRF